MGRQLDVIDQRIREFLGGPGLGVLVACALVALVVPGLAKMAGFDLREIAVVLVAVAVCSLGAGRVRRRLRGDA